MLEQVLEAHGFHEVDALTAYQDFYHFGEGYVQKRKHYRKDYEQYTQFNPLAHGFDDEYFYNTDGKPDKKAVHHLWRVVLEDDFDQTLFLLQQKENSLLDACGYLGKNYKKAKLGVLDEQLQPKAKKPQIMFGFIFEIDKVDDKCLTNLISQFTSEDMKGHNPPLMPNYLSLSGGGVHLYYVLDEPFRIDTMIKETEMNFIKQMLTLNAWNPYTSLDPNVQIQKITQGYRVFGGRCKNEFVNGEVRPKYDRLYVSVYQCRKERYSLSEIKASINNYDFLWTNDRQFENAYKDHITLDQAKKLYPEWYQKRIVEKKPKGHFIFNRALYDSFLKNVSANASYGHRYNCVLALAEVARKCDIPFEELDVDTKKLMPFFNALSPANPFYENERKQATKNYYNAKCFFSTRKSIELLSGLTINQTIKRNGLSQNDHLKIARSILKAKLEMGQATSGRKPTRAEKVFNYFKENNFDTIDNEQEFDYQVNVSQVAKQLGVTRPTVYKVVRQIKINKGWIYDEAEANQRAEVVSDTYNKFVEYVKKNNLESVINIDNLTEKQIQDLYAIVAKGM